MRQAPVSVLAIALLTLSLSACGDRSTRLCEADHFFCSKEEVWPSEAKRLTPLELYVLDERYSRVTGGGSGVLQRELATRGDEAVNAVLDHSSKEREINTYLLVDVLDQIRYASKVDICQPMTIQRVHAILGRETVIDPTGLLADERVKTFDTLCAKRE